MVLSNKKLKQKIREELAKSLVATEAQAPNHSTSKTTHNQSFKSLLDSAACKPKLSKRQIKRIKPKSFPQPTDNPIRDEGKKVETVSLQEKVENGIGEDGTNDVAKTDSFKEISMEEIGENGPKSVGEGKKRDKKRKRETKEGGEGGMLVQKNSSKKKKKKKKCKKMKKVEKGDNVEMGGGILQGGIEEPVVATAMQIGDRKEHENNSTKVYVGGIPYYSTEDDIRSYFEGCGTITGVDCLYFPETGKFKGIAMISFKTEAAANRALALDGSDMGGLFLKIQPYKASKDTKVSDFAPAILEGYNRIYVGNLSWDITEDELKKLFSDCTISSIRFGKDKETGEFRGYAHVDFVDNLSLNIALKLDQQIVCGRPVRIRCAVPPKVAKPNSKPMMTAKGHPSSDCPTSKRAEESIPLSSGEMHVPTSNGDDIKSGPAANVDAEENLLNSTLSGKMRRRTCYGCGEKGHLFSDCPTSKKAEELLTVSSSKKTEDLTTVPMHQGDDMKFGAAACVDAEENLVNSTFSGKTQRRSCDECGEKGHLSSDCPTSKKAEESIPLSSRKMLVPTCNGDGIKPGPAANVDAEENLPNSTLSGKMRRRTCYGCGEKGHLMSACPKKAEELLPVSSSKKAEDLTAVPMHRGDDMKFGAAARVDDEENSVNSVLQ